MPRRALLAAAAGLAGLAVAGAGATREEPAHAAKPPPALVPLTVLGHPALRAGPQLPPALRAGPQLPPALRERQPGPQTCLIRVERCSAEPCVQFVQRRGGRVAPADPERTDPYLA